MAAGRRDPKRGSPADVPRAPAQPPPVHKARRLAERGQPPRPADDVVMVHRSDRRRRKW